MSTRAKLLAQALFVAAVVTLPVDVALRFRLLGYNARASQLFFGLLLLVVLAEAARTSAWRRIRVPPAGVAYLAAVLLSIPWTHDPTKTVGYAAWAVFDVAVFLVGLPLFLRLYPDLRTWSVAVYLATAALVCEVAFGEIAALAHGGPRPLSAFIGTAGFPRLQALFYEPAYLAFFLVTPVAVALLWHLVRDGRPRLALVYVAVVSSATVVLSTARSGWLALAAAYVAATLVALRLRPSPRVMRQAVAVAAASGVVAVGILLAFVAAKAMGSPLERAGAVPDFARHLALFGAAQGTGNDVALRTDWYALGLRVWSEHPVFGVGIGGFGAYVVGQGYTPAIADPSKIVVPNMWVELLAETGLVGALAALALVATTAVAAIRAGLRSPAAAGCGVALAVLALVSFQFDNTFLRLDLWLPLGLATALSALSAEAEGSRLVGVRNNPTVTAFSP